MDEDRRRLLAQGTTLAGLLVLPALTLAQGQEAPPPPAVPAEPAMLAAIKGPLPFEHLVLPGQEVAATMARLRAERPGIVPVVLGDPAGLADLAQVIAANATADEVLRQGLALDLDAWMKGRVDEDPAYFTAPDDAGAVGPEPGGEDVEPLAAIRDVLTGDFKPAVVLGLVPADPPWKVAAEVRPGGWNECPPAAVQLAFFKRWHEQYGAVVTSIAEDIIEFSVARPPQTAAEARRLAREQFIYCPDIVMQGVGSEAALVAMLQGSANWFFWWD